MASPAPVREGFEAEACVDCLPASSWAISDETIDTVLAFNTSDFNQDCTGRYAIDGKQAMSFPGQPIIGAEKSYRGFQVCSGLDHFSPFLLPSGGTDQKSFTQKVEK